MSDTRARGSRLLAATAAFCAAFASAGQSWACPSCPIGQLARRQVCEQGLVQNLLVATLPFFAIVLVSVAAERIGKAKS
jgi:hypothetical protein